MDCPNCHLLLPETPREEFARRFYCWLFLQASGEVPTTALKAR